ncbi:fructose-6-phosphate aldolase [Alkalicella caledoniensis]|uniref:Fructose-6-phosphate aldolase n=1 Tax=Alkalicella caledoniensis TaxID=2731377 RepID=A0A7G9WAX3_ALKCA|nr:transaldolase family protein [Alkalicella caledoniensis]QNO15835.1 fructose-6-phosphate aldolase [Alkalicella caledoniensis]
MLLLLDTANLEDIKKGIDLYPIEGVTTNPSIIARENTNFLSRICDIKDTIGSGRMLHVQTVGLKADDIVREGVYLNQLMGDNFYVKIPVIPEGIKAMKVLKSMGVATTATAIFTPQQVVMAARAGASYAAPYINRIDNIIGDGVKVVEDISRIISTHNLDIKVLGASFKNTEQIHKACLAGAHTITAPLDLVETLVNHPLTGASVEKFSIEWESVYGKKLTYDF